ncbi:MAG: hypothetical protein LBK01_00380 [Burkholderiaceae bacterium]|nr:hypothetical protein [Burkholderiaceae bacterium]
MSWRETAKASALRRCYGAHSRVYPLGYALVVARRAPCPASRLAISRARRACCIPPHHFLGWRIADDRFSQGRQVASLAQYRIIRENQDE